MSVIRGLIIAFSTYSRIPMPRVEWDEAGRNCALCFLPLVGLVVGTMTTLWLRLSRSLALTPLLQGAVGTALPLLLTGGIHMDGFLDTSDALASWQTPERRLEILKDSHVGSGAVIACGVYLLLSAGILGQARPVHGAEFALCFVLSRTLSAWTSVTMRGARPGGMLSHFTRSASKTAVLAVSIISTLLCAGGWLLLLGWRALLPLCAAGICAIFYRHLAYRSFGGVIGDLAGWLTQVSELSMLGAVVWGELV